MTYHAYFLASTSFSVNRMRVTAGAGSSEKRDSSFNWKTHGVDVVQTIDMWPAGHNTLQRSSPRPFKSCIPSRSCTCESTSVPAMCSRPSSWAESGRSTQAKNVTKASVRKDHPCGPIDETLGLKTGRYLGNSRSSSTYTQRNSTLKTRCKRTARWQYQR